MSTKYKSNKTFGNDKTFDYNACVGQNGYVNISHYQDGYQTAVMLLIESIKSNKGTIDTLIYPLLFSARHSIELFIKKAIYFLENINQIIGSKNLLKNHLLIHDLSILWNYLKSLSTFDKRINDQIIALDDYIKDYFDVDLTGETFRYPFDTYNKHHLDDFSVINVLKFEKRFNEMIEIIEDISCLLVFLKEEYETGTFVSGLSRCEIEEISKKLPKIKEWKNESFDLISEQIKKEYNIQSNRKYSNILNLIKRHKEFSYNIGIINISTTLTKIEYDLYKQEYINSRDKERPKGIQETDIKKMFKSLRRNRNRLFIINILNKIKSKLLKKPVVIKKSYLERKHEFVNLINKKICLESIVALCTFYEIGRDNDLYSELYDRIYNYYLSREKYDLIFTFLSDGYNRIEEIEKGIKKCGQYHLLNVVESIPLQS